MSNKYVHIKEMNLDGYQRDVMTARIMTHRLALELGRVRCVQR